MSPAARPASNAILTGLVPMPLASIFDLRAAAPQYWNLTATQTIGPLRRSPDNAHFKHRIFEHDRDRFGFLHGRHSSRPDCLRGLHGERGTEVSRLFVHPHLREGCCLYRPSGLNGDVRMGTISRPRIPARQATNTISRSVTQPTAIGAAPVSNGVCTLTNLETALPACALANTTYNQASSGNADGRDLSRLSLHSRASSSAAFPRLLYYSNSNAHNAYSYMPGAHPGVPGIVTNSPGLHGFRSSCFDRAFRSRVGANLALVHGLRGPGNQDLRPDL